MYNLKIEAKKIIQELQDNGFEACFVGNYPFVKQHNLINPSNKLKIKTIDIITNAKLENIQSLFKVVKINEEYNRSVYVELPVKQNFLNFKIYHAGDYTNIINGKTKSVNTINDILNNFSFLLDTLTIDNDGKVINYINKKYSAFESISLKSLQSNGNFREKLIENPMIIFELCYYASNISYNINESNLKIITNNKDYLKYVPLQLIVKYFNKILMCKNPIVGLKIIHDCMLDFQYNGVKIFEFLKYCDNEHLYKLSDFNSSIDIISRWAYLLRSVPEDIRANVLNNLQLSYKNKILWILENYDIINDETNYKIAIYDSRESLKKIVESKWDVFLLHEMFNRLTKLHQMLNEEKQDLCQKIMDTICSRPFFKYQIAYSDDDICKIANLEKGPWLEITKENLLKKIILENKHPNDDQYMILLKESIEYGLISCQL